MMGPVRVLLATAALALATQSHAQQGPDVSHDPSPDRGLEGRYDPRNPFAEMLRGEREVARIYEDANVLAFVPLDFAAPGHALVIPKRGVRNLLEMKPAEMADIIRVAQCIARAQVAAFGATGFRLQQNNGATSNQTVFHAHLHVIPSYPTPSERQTNVPFADRVAVAERLKAKLDCR
jgi:histidine triad (HIT) family protein